MDNKIHQLDEGKYGQDHEDHGRMDKVVAGSENYAEFTEEVNELNDEALAALTSDDPLIQVEIQEIYGRVQQRINDSDEMKQMIKELDGYKSEIAYLNKQIDDLTIERQEIRNKIAIYGRPEHKWISVSVDATWDEDRKEIIVPDPVQRVVVYTADLDEEAAQEERRRQMYRDLGLDTSSSEDEVTEVAEVDQKRRPRMGVVDKLEPKPGDSVLVATRPGTLNSPWVDGRVEEVNQENGSVTIRFGSDQGLITVDKSYCAVKHVQQTLIKGGHRVVAQARDSDSTRTSEPDWFSGFVLEEATTSNSFRYLVIFDQDRVSYVEYDQLYVIFGQSRQDYIDYVIRPKDQEFAVFLSEIFLKDSYMISKVVARKGDCVRIKCRDRFPKFLILKRDCSIMKVRRKNAPSTPGVMNVEWIYRGSYRIEANYRRFFPGKDIRLKEDRNSQRRARRNPNQNRGLEFSYRSLALNDLRADNQDGISSDNDSEYSSAGSSKQRRHEARGFKLLKNLRSECDDDEEAHYHPTRSMRAVIRPIDDGYLEPEEPERVQPQRKATKEKHSKPTLLFNPNRNARSSERDPMPFVEHHCEPLCLNFGYPEGYLELHHRGENPYSIPLQYGWERSIRSFFPTVAPKRGRKMKTKKHVIYTAPCGRSCKNYRDIKRFLLSTGSALQIDYFCFEVELEIFRPLDPICCYYIEDDFSEGKELQPVSVINTINDKRPEQGNRESFEYISARVFADNLVFVNVPRQDQDIIQGLRQFKSCCSCENNCLESSKCECQLLTYQASFAIFRDEEEAESYGNRYGYVNRRLDYPKLTAIYECNEYCPCNRSCPNRVVQIGGLNQLQLFNYPNKGWGIRALHDIPKGSFICTYAAEILTPEEGDNGDRNDMYFADMDTINMQEEQKSLGQEHVRQDYDTNECPELCEFKPLRKTYYDEDGCYVLDAKFKGNLGRFFNHSCNPNCVVQNVFIDTHDMRFPEIALFTAKNVQALEEVTWDYAYVPGSVPGKYIKCHCGSRNCRGRLL